MIYVEHSQEDKQKLFFVMGLPRSGTAWLANFLTWGNSFCFHEGLFAHTSLDQFSAMFKKKKQVFVGDSDTALILILPALMKRFPEAKYVFVVREIEDIINSLDRIGVNSSGVAGMTESLWWGIKHAPNPHVIQFDKLFNQASLTALWSHIGFTEPFPWERVELLRGMHIEDGISSGFGRFVSPETVRDSKKRFDLLVKSIQNKGRPAEPAIRLM